VLAQRIEDVYRLAGKTIIVSFYATCSVANLKVGIAPSQVFGSGGSVSTGPPFALVNLGTVAWTRYSASFVMPSVAGKTIGVGHFSQLSLYLSTGSGGFMPTQSGTINFWGMQLEVAAPGQTQPSPLEKLGPPQDLANCQRFFQTGQLIYGSYSTAGSITYHSTSLPVTMRALPTMASSGPTLNNCGGFSMGGYSGSNFYIQASVTASGAFYAIVPYTASADL
jgi:hypothetical protein